MKTLLDENCRTLKNKSNQTGEVTRSLTTELNQVRLHTILTFIHSTLSLFQIAKSITTACIQLENRLDQQRGFLVELDSLIDWLSQFLEQSNQIDHQVNRRSILSYLALQCVFPF